MENTKPKFPTLTEVIYALGYWLQLAIMLSNQIHEDAMSKSVNDPESSVSEDDKESL